MIFLTLLSIRRNLDREGEQEIPRIFNQELDKNYLPERKSEPGKNFLDPKPLLRVLAGAKFKFALEPELGRRGSNLVAGSGFLDNINGVD